MQNDSAIRRYDQGFWHSLNTNFNAGSTIPIDANSGVRITKSIKKIQGVFLLIALIDPKNREVI